MRKTTKSNAFFWKGIFKMTAAHMQKWYIWN